LQDRFDHPSRELLSETDVLRILLGVHVEDRIHETDRREGSVLGVEQEPRDGPDMAEVPQEPHRIEVAGELQRLGDPA